MSYYNLLGLSQEPFSTSPDPEFFFRSMAHLSALQRLEIALRLGRGLSLIFGDVGTGKTTLCRALLQSLEDNAFEFHMILNPRYDSEYQFLNYLCRMFHVAPEDRSSLVCLETIQSYLMKKSLEENKTVVLIVDEGQNLTPNYIEILRSLLNFETNKRKLIQIVILAQLEFLQKARRIRNFMDRAGMKYVINPFGPEETKDMIRFRLEAAGYRGPGLFSEGALEQIYHSSQGYPRRITLLCHDALERLVMTGQKCVDGKLVKIILSEGHYDEIGENANAS